MQKHFKSHFPGANVPHLPEWYSLDTMFYDVLALDDGIPGHGGCTMIQMFGGLDSELLHGVPMKNESEVPDSILDFIHHYGAMDVVPPRLAVMSVCRHAATPNDPTGTWGSRR